MDLLRTELAAESEEFEENLSLRVRQSAWLLLATYTPRFSLFPY